MSGSANESFGKRQTRKSGEEKKVTSKTEGKNYLKTFLRKYMGVHWEQKSRNLINASYEEKIKGKLIVSLVRLKIRYSFLITTLPFFEIL